MKRKILEDKITGKGTQKKTKPMTAQKKRKEQVIKPVEDMAKRQKEEKIKKTGKHPRKKRNTPHKRPEEKKLKPIEPEEVKDFTGKNKMERAYQAGAFAVYQEKRRTKVTQLYLEGRSQREIAEAMEVSLSVIQNDIEAVRREWLAVRAKDMDIVKAEELARIDHLEAVSWAAWQRSCELEETFRERKRYGEEVTKNPKGGGGKMKGEKRKSRRGFDTPDDEGEGNDSMFVETTTETLKRRQNGDPRFLEMIAGCIQTRLKLLGLLNTDKQQGGSPIIINLADMIVGGNQGKQNNPNSNSAPLPVKSIEVVEQGTKPNLTDRSHVIGEDPVEVRLRQIEAHTGIQLPPNRRDKE